MSDGSKAYEQALRCPTTTRASRTRLLWDTSRFLRAHGRLKTSLKALWFATTFSLRQAPSSENHNTSMTWRGSEDTGRDEARRAPGEPRLVSSAPHRRRGPARTWQ